MDDDEAFSRWDVSTYPLELLRHRLRGFLGLA